MTASIYEQVKFRILHLKNYLFKIYTRENYTNFKYFYLNTEYKGITMVSVHRFTLKTEFHWKRS